MKFKNHLIVFFTLVIFLELFILFKPTLTSYTSITGSAIYEAVEPDLEINLTKTEYAPKEAIEGYINLILNGSLDQNTKIRASIKEKSVEKKAVEKNLIDILNYLNITYNKTEPVTIAFNPTSDKTLIFHESGAHLIAFKLPKNAVISSVDMDITGQPYNEEYPYFPYIDIGNDGSKEWQYFGNFIGYANESICPISLDTTKEYSGPLLIKSNNTLYCEVINLPYTEHFNISVKYKKINPGGDIKALILSCADCTSSTITAYGGTNMCDLPESTEKNWHSCSLYMRGNYDYPVPIQGNYLICVYSSLGDGLTTYYELSRDSTISTTGYKSNSISQGSTTCNAISSKDYFICVYEGEYSKILDGKAIFNQWFTLNSFAGAIINYLSNCTADEIGDCAVPVKISSKSKGELYLENLKIDYIESYSTKFYDIDYKPSLIYKINNTELSHGLNLTIPLSVFNLITPETEKEYKLEVKLSPGPTKETKFNVYAKIFDEITEAESLINDTKKILDYLLKSTEVEEIISILNLKSKINPALNSLANYQSQLNSIKVSNESKKEKENQSAEIALKVETLRKDLPKYINVKERVRDTIIVEPNDITDDVVLAEQRNEEDKQEIYFLQNNILVDVEAKAFTITTFSDDEEEKTLVEKVISTNLKDAYLVEVIPKSIAIDANLIDFKIIPEVIERDPIVRWYFATTPPKLIYVLPSNIISKVDLTKTIIVPKKIPEEEEKLSVCGDGICTVPLEDKITCPEDCKSKLPWLKIIILIAILGAGLYYIWFYKGKGNFKDVANFLSVKIRKKRLFTNKQDLINLNTYVKKALQQGFRELQIRDILIKKGWTKEQIDFAFKNAKKALKKK